MRKIKEIIIRIKKIFKALPTTLQENHVGRFIKKHMNNKL